MTRLVKDTVHGRFERQEEPVTGDLAAELMQQDDVAMTSHYRRWLGYFVEETDDQGEKKCTTQVKDSRRGSLARCAAGRCWRSNCQQCPHHQAERHLDEVADKHDAACLVYGRHRDS